MDRSEEPLSRSELQRSRSATYVLPRGCLHEDDPTDCRSDNLRDTDFECGCPKCLSAAGLTLVYNAADVHQMPENQSQWRPRIVSISMVERYKLGEYLVPAYRQYLPGL